MKATETWNDGIGSRGIKHICLYAAPLDGVDGDYFIGQFTGQTIPGVVTILSETYHQNGKWSHSTYQVEGGEDVLLFSISQDWGTGLWLTSNTWELAINEFKDKTSKKLPDKSVERFIRHQWKIISERLDRCRDIRNLPVPTEALLELIAAQEEAAVVREELVSRIHDEKMKAEAAEIRANTAKVKAILANGKKMSLQELQDLLGNSP